MQGAEKCPSISERNGVETILRAMTSRDMDKKILRKSPISFANHARIEIKRLSNEASRYDYHEYVA